MFVDVATAGRGREGGKRRESVLGEGGSER